MAYFTQNADDATRIVVFTSCGDLWSDIEEEVREWTLANWSRWETEKPEWFTPAFKESVPDDMMPKEALKELNMKAVGGVRRRSSVGFENLQRDSVRASVKVVPMLPDASLAADPEVISAN